MAILLETKNLSKEYHNVKAVDSFSISMEEGHIYGIIGPNGAGKTTFFKMLAGLAQPTAGEITVSGNRTIEEYRQKMSFMIEAPYLYHGMTAMENMKIIGGIKGETDEKKLQEILELLNIGNTGKKKVAQFSLGMKQRLGDSRSTDYRAGSAGIGRAHERRGTGGHCGTAAYSEKTL